jgi:hypothetical protein
MRRLMLWVASGAVLLAAPIFGVARGFLADREARGFAADCARMFAQDAGGTSDGNETRLGMHTIAIDVAIEQDRVLPTTGKHAVGVRVDCEVERHAESALRGGVVGVGDTRADAIKDALAMWVGSFGRPIADAVTGRPPLRKAGIFSVYAGRTAVRGADPDGLVDFHDRFFRELEPGLLPILTTNTMHGISILAMSAGGDDRLELEFRLDGEVSSRLRELTAKMSWPRANGSSLMRQFYVLVPR